MLNYLWGFMVLISVIFGVFNGRLEEVGNAAITSAGEAVSLCITMLGVMSLWTGLMEIAKNAGIIQMLTYKLRPFIHYLFPNIPPEHPACEHISTNFIANFLGLGWAATPAGLKAMESLSELQPDTTKKHIATDEMCTFLIINISSLQLIPVNMISYRTQYGSTSPTSIIGPAIVATFLSTLAAVVFCKYKMKQSH